MQRGTGVTGDCGTITRDQCLSVFPFTVKGGSSREGCLARGKKERLPNSHTQKRSVLFSPFALPPMMKKDGKVRLGKYLDALSNFLSVAISVCSSLCQSVGLHLFI